MGEVYKARDTKLDRDVAIKVLPVSVSRDPERLTRFEREAKVLASLNHPNIAQIYAVAEGALVMELVQGKTPAGAVPLETALSYARQIALALEAAHEKGIIHRDLKPGNIMITPEGVVKVLDFGLGLAYQSETARDPENSTTLTLANTQVGVVMGTPAYMSPEQAAGKRVDRRSDIWSFGVVLDEMLTGKRLFHGETASHTLASVLKEPIDFGRLPKITPPAIRVLLERCLDRDPKTRLRDIGEARIAIDRNSLPLPEEPAKQKMRRIWPWAAAAVFAGAAFFAGYRTDWMRPTREPQNLVTLSVAIPSGDILAPMPPVISPDGQSVWYETSDFRMFVRRIDTAEVHTVAGAAGRPVFWSPDSTTVFYSDAVGQLLKVRPALGVQEVVKTSTTPAEFFNLSESGTLLGTGRNQCLVFRPLSGGEPKALELPPQFKNGGCVSPEFLRGGDDFIFLLLPENNPEDTAVYLSSIRDGKAAAPVLLLKNRTPAHYTPAAGGRLLYVSNDNLVFAEIGPAPTPAGWRH